MYALPSPSNYILCAIVATLLATCALDSALAPVLRPQVIAESALSQSDAKTTADRSRKSDRLPVMGTDPVMTTTIILKHVSAPEHTARGANGMAAPPKALEIDDGKHAPKPKPAPLLDCEGLASPVSDPILGRFIGRCFV
jgi:hypothetical protein